MKLPANPSLPKKISAKILNKYYKHSMVLYNKQKR